MADEHSLNSNLAEILRKAGIQAEPQVSFTYNKGKRRVADLVCYEVQGHTIGIEAKYGWGNKLNANQKAVLLQADEAVEYNACDAAVALIYQDGLTTAADVENGKAWIALRTPILIGKKKPPEWNERAVKDLPDYIKGIPSQLGKPEELAKRAENAVNQAFQKFSKADTEYIMRSLGEEVKETKVKELIKGLLIDLLTCFMFHTKLDEIVPQHFAKTNRPPTVAQCLENDSIALFAAAYEKWLVVDYKDILEWSCAILKALPARPRSNDAVKILAKTAQSIQRAKGSQHHDVVGITFANSIETAKHDGSFYTTLPAATMLTRLLFHNAKIDWKNLEEIKSLRIVDFACGSGTLLIACANYILQKERTENKEEVAKALLEQMLYGFDINDRAVFQTATGLGMISPSIAFKHMHLYSMVYGVPKGKSEARIGSLEMIPLEGLNLITEKNESYLNPPVIARKVDSPPAPIECDQFHMTIMNPPFTRKEIRNKQKDKKTEKLLREREAKLSTEEIKLNSSAGTAIGFLAIADKYLHPSTGKAALILPTTFSGGLPPKIARIRLAKKFHVKNIIVSYDPQRIGFSGNTKIGEMMLVLERRKSGKATKVIKLTQNPDNESEAIQCAKDILRGRGDNWGTVDEIPRGDMEKGDWSAVQFVSNELYRIAKEIPKQWKSRFGNQVKTKILRNEVLGKAQKCDPREMQATHALYNHCTNHCDKLEVKPDCFIRPNETNTNFDKSLLKIGYLKITERACLTTIKNVACRTTVPSLGCWWYGAEVVQIPNVDEATVEKAATVILNSTICKIGMLFERTNKKPSYVRFSIDGLIKVPMPSLYALKPSQFRALAKVYDELCKQPRQRLPEAHNCSVQIAIDQAVCQHTGFPEKLCRQARHLLSHEPMVTGQRYQSNPKETNPKLPLTRAD